jgi:hypothetical protein
MLAVSVPRASRHSAAVAHIAGVTKAKLGFLPRVRKSIPMFSSRVPSRVSPDFCVTCKTVGVNKVSARAVVIFFLEF